MPMYLVQGRDRQGETFRRRFEAPSESELTLFLSARSLQITSLTQLPLSSWPFSRIPFVAMLFPLFAWGVISFGGATVRGAWLLAQEQKNQEVYQLLARQAVPAEGRVMARREEAQRRGRPVTVLEYQYRDPAGLVHRGLLTSRPGNARQGQHELALLGNRELAEGDTLSVFVHPATPLLHAPFPLDEELFARHAALLRARQRAAAISLAALAACAWLVWNVGLRLGSQFEHSSDPRIVEISGAGSVLKEQAPPPLGEPPAQA